MSEEERKFLEIVDLKKGFGSGETRQEGLRGMNSVSYTHLTLPTIA